MLRFVAFAALLVFAALVEATVGHRLELGGGRASVVLLLVLSWAALRGKEEGLLGGLVGGLALDLVSGAPFGLHALLLSALGGLTGAATDSLAHGGVGTLIGVAILATVAYHLAAALALALLGWWPPGPARLVEVITPSVLMNAALMPFAFLLTRRLARALSGWRQLELE